MKRIAFLACMSAILISSVSAQWWLSSLSLDTMATPSPVTYDPYSGNDTTGPQFTFTVRLSRMPWTTVNFCAVIDGSLSPSSRLLSSSSNSLTVNFYQDSNYTKEIKSSADYTSSTIVSGSFPAFTTTLTKTYTVYPRLDKGQSAPWGTYTGNFTVKLYNYSLPYSSYLKDSESFTYTAIVAQTVEVRVGPSSGSFDTGMNLYSLDLGEVSKGASASFGIFVKGTTGYTLTMNVASGGYLTSDTTNDKIQYSLTINGKNYSLGPAVTIDVQTARALYSKVLLGTITIPPEQNVESGQYSDTISFSVTAN